MNETSLRPLRFASILMFVVASISGCVQKPESVSSAAQSDSPGMDHAEAPKAGIPIPASVRDNLGITFATVTSRAVAETRRVPGQFELLPTARQEYRAILDGRVELKVEQFQVVAAGDVLFTIDSPQWRQMQHEAVEAEGDITMAEAALKVARAYRQETQSALSIQEERVRNLASVNVRKAELEASASNLRNSLPRLDAETSAQESALREAHEHYESRLNALSTVTGLPIDALREREREGAQAAWRSIAVLPVRAQSAGTVETLVVNNGGWLESGTLAMTIVDPAKVRFHAEAPQSDLAHFRDGQTATVVPPQGSSVEVENAITGTLTLGLTANEHDRTLSLYVTPHETASWTRAGVAGFLEVTLKDDAPTQLAIPAAAIIQDGLEHVYFRRDPKDPDRALRLIADLGPTDGRWTVLRSGVKEGDEVVLDGVYALKLTSSQQQAPPGYHYHADGALHKNH